MNTEYGKQIALAFAAIEQLFEDTSKLLQDCDKVIAPGRASLFGNEVTRDLSRAIGGPGSWTPSALYRYYDFSEVGPGLVTGICVRFRDDPGVFPKRVEEPLIIIGQIRFNSQFPIPTRNEFKPWTIWDGFYVWSEKRPLDEVIAHEANLEAKVPSMKLIAAPLYSIHSVGDVEGLLARVVAAPWPDSSLSDLSI